MSQPPRQPNRRASPAPTTRSQACGLTPLPHLEYATGDRNIGPFVTRNVRAIPPYMCMKSISCTSLAAHLSPATDAKPTLEGDHHARPKTCAPVNTRPVTPNALPLCCRPLRDLSSLIESAVAPSDNRTPNPLLQHSRLLVSLRSDDGSEVHGNFCGLFGSRQLHCSLTRPITRSPQAHKGTTNRR